MGASGWQVRVAYQEDIGAALQQARQRAYDEGGFHRQAPNGLARSMSEEEYVAWCMAQAFGVDADDERLEPTRDMIRGDWRAAHVVVTGPDSLLASQPDSGTHSIIDMTHVADRPDYFAVAPIPPQALEEIFGTTRPTVAAIEAAIEERRTYGFRSWHGMYLVGYRDDQPEEIFFVGFSGD